MSGMHLNHTARYWHKKYQEQLIVTDHQSAELIRMRNSLESLHSFVSRFPLMPSIEGTGTTEQRAFEMKEKTRESISRILDGPDKEKP